MPLVDLETLIAGAIAGRVVSFPTDTVPALGVRPENAAQIFTLKQRSPDKPLILLGASPCDLWPYTMGTDAEQSMWEQMARKYWPGQLTAIVKASPKVPRAVHPADPSSIGLRIPQHPLALNILEQTGVLATTSANRSGDPPFEDMEAIAIAFPEVLTLQCSNSGNGTPSTVVKWNETHWDVLRQGATRL